MSERPYKKAKALDDSLADMNAGTGSLFDPKLMTAFNKALPDILKIQQMYADERGPLTDLDPPFELAANH